jgi:hypothetical protein
MGTIWEMGGNQEDGSGGQERVMGAAYNQRMLHACKKCPNETHYFVQLIHANKNK